jgi:hypothetical protein
MSNNQEATTLAELNKEDLTSLLLAEMGKEPLDTARINEIEETRKNQGFAFDEQSSVYRILTGYDTAYLVEKLDIEKTYREGLFGNQKSEIDESIIAKECPKELLEKLIDISKNSNKQKEKAPKTDPLSQIFKAIKSIISYCYSAIAEKDPNITSVFTQFKNLSDQHKTDASITNTDEKNSPKSNKVENSVNITEYKQTKWVDQTQKNKNSTTQLGK